MVIKIFTTGGTIDKIYFDRKSAYQVGEPQILRLLHEANVTFDYAVESILRKDSLDLDDNDRRLIRARVAASGHARIVVTHGTDTMVRTAMELMGVENKTVVLTGSMQPAKLQISDAVFNIGYAMAAAQCMPAGIYIAMNGQLFDPRRAHKCVEENRFETLDEPGQP
jgi:L-asparaginase